MVSRCVAPAVAAVGAMFAVIVPAAGPAAADETGLAGMHAWVKVGKLTCYADHTHYASSLGHRNKKAALAEAAKSWTEFTAWEYGTSWANFNNAAARKADCKQSSSGWACDVEARPCRGR